MDAFEDLKVFLNASIKETFEQDYPSVTDNVIKTLAAKIKSKNIQNSEGNVFNIEFDSSSFKQKIKNDKKFTDDFISKLNEITEDMNMNELSDNSNENHLKNIVSYIYILLNEFQLLKQIPKGGGRRKKRTRRKR